MRHRADDIHAPRIKVKTNYGQRRCNHRKNGPGLYKCPGETGAHSKAFEQRAQSRARSKREPRRQDAKRQGDQINISKMHPKRCQDFGQSVSIGVNAQRVPQLTGRDQQA